MSIFTKHKSTGGIMDVIRCDESSYLIWKWHPKGTQSGKNNRENAIRIGSSLRVREGEVAVFVYKQDRSTLQDFIIGPYEQIIKTSNFPVLSSIIGLAYDGGTPFPAEVYFINLAQVIQIKFGVPFFDIFDPRFSDFGVPIVVRGTITFRITDYREFIRLHRLDSFDLTDFQNQIRDVVVRYVKATTANAPSRYNISVLQIERKIPEINEEIESELKDRLKKDFGVTVSGVDISAIEIDKESDSYSQLKAVTQDSTASVLRAQTAVNIKEMQDKQQIEAENYAETLRIQREEAQYAQHKQTQTANLTALQIEKQSEVGIAGANALGQMGSNNAGNISGSGFNPAAMIAGMTLGGTPESLVWKEGMAEWKKAATIPELKVLFPEPPPIPPIPTT